MKGKLLPQWLNLLQHLSLSRNCGTPLRLCFHSLKVQDEILGYKTPCGSWGPAAGRSRGLWVGQGCWWRVVVALALCHGGPCDPTASAMPEEGPGVSAHPSDSLCSLTGQLPPCLPPWPCCWLPRHRCLCCPWKQDKPPGCHPEEQGVRAGLCAGVEGRGEVALVPLSPQRAQEGGRKSCSLSPAQVSWWL